ncbi:MAG: translocation/assembly module TamB domain-containing protein [Vicinamibacterales bacterium]
MRAARCVLVAATLAVMLAALAAIASQTSWARELLRQAVIDAAAHYLGGSVAIDRIGGNVFSGIEIHGLAVVMEGEVVVSVPHAAVRYDVYRLLSDRLSIASIRLDRPAIYVRRDARGWNVLRLLKDRETRGPRRQFSIESIEVAGGSVHIGGSTAPGAFRVPARLTDLNLQAAAGWGPSGRWLRIGRLAFESESPALRVEAATGSITAFGERLSVDGLRLRTTESSVAVDGQVERYRSTPDYRLRCEGAPLSLDEAGRILPALAATGLDLAFELSARGQASALAVNIELRSDAGNVNAQATADIGRRSAKGTAWLRRVNLAPLFRDASRQTDIGGEVDFDLRWAPGGGPLPVAGRVELTGGRVRVLGYEAEEVRAAASLRSSSIEASAAGFAYGANATASAVIRLPGPGARDPIEYKVRGRVTNASLARLPAFLSLPPASSRFDFEYSLAGSGSRVSGGAVLGPSDLAGAAIAAGTTVSFLFSPGSLEYRAKGVFENLDVAAVGRELGMAAIDGLRFATIASGPFEVTGTAGGSHTRSVAAHGTLHDSTVFGALIPTLDYEVRLAGVALATNARGTFRGLDPAAVTRSSAFEGTLNGWLDVQLDVKDVRVQSSWLDRVSVGGRVSLGPSTFRGVAFDRAEVRGRFAGRRAEVDELVVSGPAIAFDALGAVSFSQEGDSNLRFHAASTDLAAAGQPAGLALGGEATVDGVVTGNARMLAIRGDARSAGFRYGDYRATEAHATYEAELQEFDVSRLQARAEAHAAGISAVRQEIDSISAKLVYAERALRFDAALEQQPRRGEVAGRAVFDNGRCELDIDYAEVTLGASGGDVWSLVPDAGARVGIAGKRLLLEGIRFRNGLQEVAVDGVLDPQASHIRAEASGVDLASLSPLFQRGRRLEGRLTGVGSASGPRDALVMAGEFSVSRGSFDGVGFEKAAVRAGYGHGMISLDLRVDQSIDSWIEARGSVPALLFSSSRGPVAPGPDASDGLDVTLRTGRLPMSLLDGLLPHLESIGGTMQVDARLTGSLSRPTVHGFVDLIGGSFNVVPSGAAYRALNARLRLEGDRIRVDNLRVVDERGRPLSVSGQIGVRGRAVGHVDLSIDAADFTVIDNDLGRLRLAALMRASGDVRRPVITGAIEVGDGTILLDRVLEALDAARLEVLEGAQPLLPATASPRGEPSVFDAATVDLAVRIPNNLVVRGTDVGSGRSLVGFGDVNVTFGGDVKLQKLPFEPPALLGEVRTVRGTYDFQGRRFDIVRGSGLRFHGLSPIDPSLEVKASRTISGVETLVQVRGTLRQPELQLSSVPQLDEADILSLIMFNQPANELGSGQQISLAERAGIMAGGFVTSRLAQSINRALKFDVLEIQAQAERGSGVGATITVGEQVGDRLYLRLRQVIGENSVTQFALEYEIAEFARLETSVTQGQSVSRSLLERLERGGLDLIFFFSY